MATTQSESPATQATEDYTVSASFDLKGTTQTLSYPTISYGDLALVENGPNKSVATNLLSPLDLPELLRIERQNVANIYTNTDIPRSLWATSTRGYSLVGQDMVIFRVTGSQGMAQFVIDLPVEAHWVLKVPATPYLGIAEYDAVLSRAMGLKGPKGENLEKALRGATNPLDFTNVSSN